MDTPNRIEFLRLVEKYLDGTANAKQASAVEQYFDLFSTEPDILDTVGKKELRTIHDRLKSAIDTRIDQEDKFHTVDQLNIDHEELQLRSPVHTTLRKLWRYLPRVAAVIFVLAAYYLYSNRAQRSGIQVAKAIPAAGNKAVLILSNGRKIDLSGSNSGILTVLPGVKVSKTADGQLVYTLTDQNNKSGVSEKNTIVVPNGGHYRVNLPDGSRIYLNAASSLTYPSSFAALKERIVSLQGEAYFEVARDKVKPFKVQTGNQQIEVLGTHFNINGYKDEKDVRTTLLEGSVRVTIPASPGEILKPGQQSIVSNNGNIKIAIVDTVQAIAWKNGDFQFDQDLKSVMREISRWYNVEITYEKDVPENLILLGWVSRRSDLDSVLSTIEKLGGIHFKINGRRVTVMK